MDKSQDTIRNRPIKEEGEHEDQKPSSSSGSESGSSSSSSANSQKQPGVEGQSPETITKPKPRTQRSSRSHDYTQSSEPRRRRRRRTNTKTRRQSAFMDAPPDVLVTDPSQAALMAGPNGGGRRASEFYSLRVPKGAQNLSSTSLESNALLDHREHPYIRPRRASTLQLTTPPISGRGTQRHTPGGNTHAHPHSRWMQASPYDENSPQDLRRGPTGDYASDSEVDVGDSAPLLSRTPASATLPTERIGLFSKHNGRPSSTSSRGSGKRKQLAPLGYGSINFPPSMPASPTLDPRANFDNMSDAGLSPNSRSRGDQHISIDSALQETGGSYFPASSPPKNLRTIYGAEEDVCFPIDDDDVTDGGGTPQQANNEDYPRGRRRRARRWPDLDVLDEWSREEKEERSDGIRARKISEPLYVGGRLRPNLRGWHRDEEDVPYRFTYFNDELSSTIHAQTISELVTPGQTTFKDLFIPDFRRYSEDEMSSDEESRHTPKQGDRDEQASRNTTRTDDSMSRTTTKASLDLLTGDVPQRPSSIDPAGPMAKPRDSDSHGEGERPTWWLDVMSPTKAEMKVLQDTFGIHPLTAEDILMEEAREKVELFRNYYLVSYRTFEQDPNDENYMEPVNFYVVVFRDGVLSFHFSMTPHGANVRRRIRQLKDYMTISSDWICYALIDNITDAFQPLIQSIEDEVDTIDDHILDLPKDDKTATAAEKKKEEDHDDSHMLRKIANCRKKVMGLYRLINNKADVIKGFSKRCNEQWEVAPRSEIGLYLGDIQDHIVTMVANLVHVEKILSRGHSNYLAQISLKMNARQEETADVLGRLTVLGTIVLPMNIITGLWGMNVLVPGQGDDQHLTWFWCITGSLVLFGFLCYTIAKRVYNIV